MRGLIVGVLVLAAACSTPRSQVPEWALAGTVTEGGFVLVSGLGRGADGPAAVARAQEAARAEALKIRSVHVQSSFDSRSEARFFTDGSEQAEELIEEQRERLRLDAGGELRGTVLREQAQWQETDAAWQAAARVAVPRELLYPAEALRAAGGDAGHLSSQAVRFAGLGLRSWARAAREMAALESKEAGPAVDCARFFYRAGESAVAERWLVIAQGRGGSAAAIAELRQAMGAAPELAQLLYDLERLADAARRPERFTVELPQPGTLHYAVQGAAARLLLFWEDGEDLSRLRLSGEDRAFSGVARSRLDLAAGQAGQLIAFALPPGQAVFERAEGLPAAGLSLLAEVDEAERRLLQDVLRALQASAQDGELAAWRLRVGE